MEPAITIENLDFFYDQQPILEKVSLTIESGEFIGIIGPNGGGKTTLLKLIMGFLSPQNGSIRIFGKEKVENCISYVPQSHQVDKLFPITVFELILTGLIYESGFFGRYSKKAKKAAEELLEKLDLSSYKKASFGELSGGIAQRVLIARALISDPKILLLDEPTSNVDANARKSIYSWIFSLKKEKTILMVTHDLDIVIENIEKILCVEKHISPLLPSQVCEHFALGLYHTPLFPKKEKP